MGSLKADDQIRPENERTLHFALTPFRILQDVALGVLFVVMLIGWIFVSQIGWIVDLGPRSERARDAMVDQVGRNISAPGEGLSVLDLTVNFTDRAYWDQDRSSEWAEPDFFWADWQKNYEDAGLGLDPPAIDSFQIQQGRQSLDIDDHGIQFCHVGHPGLYSTALGSWSDRGDPGFVLGRKSARMRRDFETAAIMISALRSALAHLKAGQTLASEYGPASGLPLEDSYCNADGADPALLTPAQLAAYRSATYQIHLEEAPEVTFRLIYYGADNITPWREDGTEIVGMCDGCDPDNDLMYSTTLYADLFDKEPPLSDAQERAEKELLKTANMAFWLQEARENGITDTAPLAAENLRARQDLAAIFGDPIPQ